MLPSSRLDDPPPPMLASDSADSSSSSSSPPLRHRLTRKRTYSPSSRHFRLSPRPYSPSSREADIARLLDPAYASPAPNSPLTRSPRMAVKEVYVDHHGDLHDPDFRDFPPFGHARHPRWERAYADDSDDDSDDEETLEQQHRPSLDLQRRRPSPTYHSPPVYYPYEEPASYESRYLADVDDDDEDSFERAPLKEMSFCRRPRSPTRRSGSQEEKQSSPAAEGDQVIQADSDWTPTCTQTLRRHWQAISLSFRFSIFRTKRRLRRHMTG